MTVETVPSPPHTISRRAEVGMPAATLFAILANPHRHHELDGSGTVKEKVTGPTSVKLGDTFTVAMKQMGLPYKIKSKVVALEQDRVIEWKHPAGHTWRWELEATTPTTTTVTETWDASKTPAYFAFALMGVPGRNAEGIEKTLERLQAEHAA